MSILDNFTYGVATSSFQIEGAYDEDGKSLSIWDKFCDVNGNICDGTDGRIACDHYHRFKEDVKIIKELGVKSYRFSISWPRIFPKKGEFNEKGMEFYVKLVDELRKNGIKPAVTLYHWDMPLWVDEEGGWTNRKTVYYFMEFAKKCFEYLDDKVDMWITINEPWCVAFLGYLTGEHAPGHKDYTEALKAAHHLLLAHGECVNYYKNEFKGENPIGITLNLSPVYTTDDSYNNYIAQTLDDGYVNRWFLDPIFKGKYPMDIVHAYSSKVKDFNFIKKEDFKIISVETDFLGINYYTRHLIEYNPDDSMFLCGWPGSDEYERSDMGWEVIPEGLEKVVKRIRKEYTDIPIIITENGYASDDKLEGTEVHDKERCNFLKAHIDTVKKLNAQGMNIKGYYAWSLMDNFEWAFGYSKRFGLVYVDYETQKRFLKDSAKIYKEFIK